MKFCTYRACQKPPTRRLQRSNGTRPWYGCDDHWKAMQDALQDGLSGVTSGSAWVEVREIGPDA